MVTATEAWDYLILTASNEAQAVAYRRQLALRRQLGLLLGVREILVVADPGGRRVGSGGSTLWCLLEVLNRELASQDGDPALPEVWLDVLQRLRILIIHGGGESRGVPAYGPCGKLFVPLPVPSDSALGTTLFDNQWPIYRRLPRSESGAGQTVICAGDVLLDFSPEEIVLSPEGITGLGCLASPEQASRHGVYCVGPGGRLRRFLQKPAFSEQAERGAIDDYGQTVLDIGVFGFDPLTAVQLLTMCGTRLDGEHRLAWNGPLADAITSCGLDFYREICCALGSDCTLDGYHKAIQAADSAWAAPLAGRIFDTVCSIPSCVHVLKRCEFLHLSTTRDILYGGQELLRRSGPALLARRCVSINNCVANGLNLAPVTAWVEGCSIEKPVSLGGENLLVGVDVHHSLELSPDSCLDVIPGRNHAGQPVVFVRCYRNGELLKNTASRDLTFCGHPLHQWLTSAGARPEDIWDESAALSTRSVWNARLFPAESNPRDYHRWLWLFEPAAASPEQLREWLCADRYSLEEMSPLIDQEVFHGRRLALRENEIRRSLRQYFRPEGGFSAADLAYLLAHSREPEAWMTELMAEARWRWERRKTEAADEAFVFPRIMHTIGSTLLRLLDQDCGPPQTLLSCLDGIMEPADRIWRAELDLGPVSRGDPRQWAQRARHAAFQYLRRRIVSSNVAADRVLRNTLRSDEIVWGRAPARLDLGGGWSDTPPYSLEHGGCVLNAAVELNGQPPVQAYARVTPEFLIRCRSIDGGNSLEIRQWDELLDYQSPTADFALVKAALVFCGFTPEGQREGQSLQEVLTAFGGGLEMTTLAAIPKGSGLGTSSIMGAVLLAVIHRVMGRQLPQGELFHAVLRLEQALTTGGGWQDQIGGTVGELKLITTQPGLVPEAAIRYVPADVLTPASRGGVNLLYYTGITRLAKNILEEVVGSYLDRDREAVAILRRLGTLATEIAEAASQRNLVRFGRLIDQSWQFNKRLDPHSTSEGNRFPVGSCRTVHPRRKTAWGRRRRVPASGLQVHRRCQPPETPLGGRSAQSPGSIL